MKNYLLRNGKKYISVLLVALMMFSLVSTGAAESYSSDNILASSEANNTDDTTENLEDITSEASTDNVKEYSSAENKGISGTIKGSLWLDSNTNGIWDEEEYGIPGLTVALYEEGGKIAEAVTESDGSYIFENLQTGDYIVGVMAQTVNEEEYLIPMKSLQSGEDNKFDANWDTDPVVSESSLITLGDGDVIEGIDAGMRGKVQVVPAATTTVNTFSGLKSAIDNAASGDIINISGNITMTECLSVPFGKNITIQSSTSTIRTLTRSSANCTDGDTANTYTHRHFWVEGSLTLKNITLSGLGYTSGTSTVFNGGINVSPIGTLNIGAGVTITKCYNRYGTIYDMGTINMSGGSITQNNVLQNGGGIFAARMASSSSTAAVNMTGGTISNNTIGGNASLDAAGGGIYSSKMPVKISGGTITGNKFTSVRSSTGGGIRITSETDFIMTGGTISNNSAEIGGGLALFGSPSSETTISNSVISGNTALEQGGGIDISGNTGTEIHISNTEITGNEVTGSEPLDGGGAIHIGASEHLYINNSQITNNTSAVNGGAIYAANYSYLNPVSTAYYAEMTISSDVVFSGNKASKTAVPPTNKDDFNSRFDGNLLNNDDINYAPTTYTVTYDANGGTGAPAAQEKQYNTPLTLSSVIPTRANYNFLGWSSSSTATKPTYAAGGLYELNSKVTLYAVWEIKTYTISYSANGGTGAPASQTKTHNVSLTLSTTKPTRTGYTFLGWSTSSTATTAAYAAGGAFNLNVDTTLYAVWKANTYTISYNANGGTGAPASQTKTHGVNLTLSTTKPTRTGYTFLGWGTTSTTTVVTYAPGANYTTNANRTLYAVWEANTYTISYNANSGTGAPASQTKTHNVSLKLSTTIPTREGHTFLGWSASSTATTATYAAGGTFTLNANTTLYAVWEADTYIITYDANGGTGAPQPQEKKHDIDISLTTVVEPTWEGHGFLGWSTEATDIYPEYAHGGLYTANESVTLYAVWSTDTYVIKYDANGGTGAPGNQIKTHDLSLNLSTVKPTRTNYTFMGWATSSTAATAAYAPGAIFTTNASTTLYAVWALNYKVTFNANGGVGAPSSQTKVTGVTLVLSSVEPTREGYTFLGWGTTSTTSVVAYAPGANYTAEGNRTLYAVWEANKYTVTYVAADAPAAQEKIHDVDLVLSDVILTREGYTFLGWATHSATFVPTYLPGSTYTRNADLKLYPVWHPNPYYISYDANGGTGEPERQIKAHDIDLTLSETEPTRDGYIFLGWATSKTATTAEYTGGDSFATNSDTTLYAVWLLDSDSFVATTENIILSGHWAGEQTGEAVFWISLDNMAISEEVLAEISFEHSNALLWKGEKRVFHTVEDAYLTGNTKTENGKVWSEVKLPVEVYYTGVSKIVAKSGTNILATAYVITPGNNASEYGVLDSADVTEVIRVINRKVSSPGKGIANNFLFEMMDMNKDRIINSSDAADIIRLINGKQFYHKD